MFFTMTGFRATMVEVLATVYTGEMVEIAAEYWREVTGVLVAFLAMLSAKLESKLKLGEEMASRLGEEQRKLE